MSTETMWSTACDELTIIDNTKEGRRNFGFGWGANEVLITEEQIEALRTGKTLANFDGEYVTFITMEKQE